MYFPYLRTKQNEMRALFELTPLLKKNRTKIMPILDPVKLRKPSIKTIKNLSDNDIPFIFIVNPKDGDYKSAHEAMSKFIHINLKKSKCVIPGFTIDKGCTLSHISDFITNFNQYPLALIHRSTHLHGDDINALSNRISFNIFLKDEPQYRSHFQKHTSVLLQDSFIKAKRNADYPPLDFYSDLYSTFSDNYIGFGDFQMVGDHAPRRGGGPAHAVALHFSYICCDKLYMAHFISDDTQTSKNIQAKFQQSLNKLISFAEYLPPIHKTFGYEYFFDLYNDYKYPGNNLPKKHLIKHHIQLILSII